MSLITFGLSKIEVGAKGSGGTMGTSLATLGYTYEDTCKLTTDDPEVTEFYAEEVDDPIKIVSKKGKTVLAFSIANPDLDTLVAVLGGTKVGTDPNFSWEAPTELPSISQSVKVTPREGLVISIPNGKVEGKLNGEFSRKGLFMIDVTVTVQVPEDEDTAPIIAVPKS